MNLELAGRCAIITGGIRNLGAAITRALIEEGAQRQQVKGIPAEVHRPAF